MAAWNGSFARVRAELGEVDVLVYNAGQVLHTTSHPGGAIGCTKTPSICAVEHARRWRQASFCRPTPPISSAGEVQSNGAGLGFVRDIG